VIWSKKFTEELIAYFPWYDTGYMENDASNNSSIVACIRYRGNVFTKPLPDNDIALLQSRCLATICGVYLAVA
jgi:hypothetical protein